MSLRNYFSLLKVFLKNQYGIAFFKKKSFDGADIGKSGKIKADKKVFAVLGGLIIFAIILFYIISACIVIVPQFAANNLLSPLITVMITAVQLIVLFFGMTFMLPYLFFSKDSEFLQSLPVKKSVVFMAKFTVVYINELLISVIILLPFLITVGVVSSLNAIYIPIVFYFNTIIIIIFSPLMPLAIASLIAYPFIYLINRLKNKPLLSGLISTFLMILLIGPIFFLSYGLNTSMSSVYNGSLVINESLKETLVWFMTYMYPNNVMASSMLLENGISGYFISLAIYFAFALFFGFLSVTVSSFLYGKALSLNIEGESGKKKRIKKSVKFKKTENPVLVMAGNNLKSFLKEPIFAMNILSMPIFNMLIVSFFCWIFTRQTGSSAEIAGDYFDFNFFTLGMCIYILSLTLSTGNYLAITPASIEGKNLFFIKTLPISFGDFVKSKLLLADGISAITVLLASIPFWCLGRQNILNAVLFPFVLIFYSLAINRFGFYFDFKNPRLNWSNYSEFKKSGLKLWRQMLVGITVPVITVISCSLIAAIEIHYALKSLIIFSPYVFLSAVLFFVFGYKVKRQVPQFIQNTE